MKLYAFIVALSVFMSYFAVHAEDDDVQIVDQTQTSAMVYRDSSEANRIHKKLSLQWQIFGLGSNGTSQGGLVAGYHLNRNSVLQLEAGSGGVSGPAWFSTSNFAMQSSVVGVQYKRFLGNSFYVKMGVDYRDMEYTYAYASANRTNFTGNSVNASLVIGNQWQWDYFTLGCDWVGYSVPLTTTITSESSTSNDPFYLASLKDDEQRYLKNGFPQLLRFYIGATF